MGASKPYVPVDEDESGDVQDVEHGEGHGRVPVYTHADACLGVRVSQSVSQSINNLPDQQSTHADAHRMRSMASCALRRMTICGVTTR